MIDKDTTMYNVALVEQVTKSMRKDPDFALTVYLLEMAVLEMDDVISRRREAEMPLTGRH